MIDEIFGLSDLDGIVMMVSKLVDVACDKPGDQDCVLTGDGAAAGRIPNQQIS